ncbi:MAG: flagellar hook-length control protein FliK [Hyphomicrobiales bacterium]|nr:flagellar hook-length control protein FliK [Hyphomicrobiales bacterium]
MTRGATRSPALARNGAAGAASPAAGAFDALLAACAPVARPLPKKPSQALAPVLSNGGGSGSQQSDKKDASAPAAQGDADKTAAPAASAAPPLVSFALAVAGEPGLFAQAAQAVASPRGATACDNAPQGAPLAARPLHALATQGLSDAAPDRARSAASGGSSADFPVAPRTGAMAASSATTHRAAAGEDKPALAAPVLSVQVEHSAAPQADVAQQIAAAARGLIDAEKTSAQTRNLQPALATGDAAAPPPREISKVTITLAPEHLGKVTVEMKFAQGEVHLRILADATSGVSAIRNEAPALERLLASDGLNIGALVIAPSSASDAPSSQMAPDFSNGGQSFGRRHESRAAPHGDGFGEDDEVSQSNDRSGGAVL